MNSYTALLLENIHIELAKAYQDEYNKDALKMAGLSPGQEHPDETH